MALVTVTTESGEMVLSLQVGDADLQDGQGALLVDTTAMVSEAIRWALVAEEEASYPMTCGICGGDVFWSEEGSAFLHEASDVAHEARP